MSDAQGPTEDANGRPVVLPLDEYVVRGEQSAYPAGFDNWPLERRNGYFSAKAEVYRETRQASEGKPKTIETDAPPLLFVAAADYYGKTPPDRKWIVPEWIPCGVVAGLYGDGGIGKTLLVQQLQTSTSLPCGWLGLDVEPMRSIGIYCEDSGDELWRRQVDINAAYGCDFDALSDVRWLARLGEDNIMMTFNSKGVGEFTKFHAQVLEMALDFKARLLIIDTAADVYGGNENDRGQVRQFVQRACGSIALKIGGSVIVAAHPSRAGIKTGEGDGGSTGWSNAFRSRLYLREPQPENGEKLDGNDRILERRKANYAARKDELRLRWRHGVIEPEAPASPGLTTLGSKVDALDLFVDLVGQFQEQNRTISQVANSGNYAPRVFGRLPREQRRDFKEADFRAAMEKAFADGKIENVLYGRPGDERRKLVLIQRPAIEF